MLSPITPHISLYLWKEYTESDGDNFENSWIRKKYPDILESDPDQIMLKLKDLAFIPKDEWPDEVLENYNNRLEESKIIHAKYCTNYKVKEEIDI